MLDENPLDLEPIKDRLERQYVFTNDEGHRVIDGGGQQKKDIIALLAEVERLKKIEEFHLKLCEEQNDLNERLTEEIQRLSITCNDCGRLPYECQGCH